MTLLGYGIVQLVYSRKSICPCGFSVLKDDIPLGKQYWTMGGFIRNTRMECGGCGKILAVTLTTVVNEDGVSGGDLPIEIFSEEDQKYLRTFESHNA